MKRPVVIRIEDLHKSFGDDPVLRGIDLEFRQGDLSAIVGGSGCGKTVLLQHVSGHLVPDRGRVLVADHEQPGAPLVDIASLDDQEMDRIRIHCGFVYQRNALFSDTVYENVALWLREIKRLDEEEIRSRAVEAVSAVGLDPDRVLQKHRSELSGGMAKRVAVARALAMRPLLMFYDEPTTGLDPVNAAAIHELIVKTHEMPGEGGLHPTTFIITHDKDLLARLEPRIVMLHDGEVFFDGPYEEFEKSDSEIVQPYFEEMPVLHRRKLAV